MRTIRGRLDATGFRFGLVVSMYNEFVTSRLLAGAVEALTKAGAAADAIEIVQVPGAFEIPLVARRLARTGRVDAVICLGAVIRGETPHFEYISTEACRGIARVALESDLPVVFGVLTTDNVEQAMERAGGPERNRGAEAARTAIEMTRLMKELPVPRERAPRKRSPSKRSARTVTGRRRS